MAAGALGVEIGLSRARIADEHAGRFLADRWRHALPADGFDDAANVGGYRQRILFTHLDGGHALGLAAALDDGDNQFAVQIAEGELRAEQVGSAEIAAAEVGSVAAVAIDAI